MDIDAALDILGPIRCVRRGEMYWLDGAKYFNEDDVICAAIASMDRLTKRKHVLT